MKRNDGERLGRIFFNFRQFFLETLLLGERRNDNLNAQQKSTQFNGIFYCQDAFGELR